MNLTTNKKEDKTNWFTSIEQTLVRRINRNLRLYCIGNQLQAVLPCPATIKTGDLLTRVFDKSLVIEKSANGYKAQMFTRQAVKKTYWKKWRNVERVDYKEFSDKNFNRLIKQVSFD